MEIDWKHKLTSRKFWMAFSTMVSGLILAFGGNPKTAETVCGCIMSVASCVAYVIGEGLADAASMQYEDIWVEEEDKPPADEQGE